MAVSFLTYGHEVCVINWKDVVQIQATEMHILKAMKGCYRRDHIRNEDIRLKLNICSIDDIIKWNKERQTK